MIKIAHPSVALYSDEQFQLMPGYFRYQYTANKYLGEKSDFRGLDLSLLCVEKNRLPEACL